MSCSRCRDYPFSLWLWRSCMLGTHCHRATPQPLWLDMTRKAAPPPNWHFFLLLTWRTIIFTGLQTYTGLHVRKTLTNKKTNNSLWDPQDGSAGKDTCCQSWWSNLNPLDPWGKRSETSLTSCPVPDIVQVPSPITNKQIIKKINKSQFYVGTMYIRRTTP